MCLRINCSGQRAKFRNARIPTVLRTFGCIATHHVPGNHQYLRIGESFQMLPRQGGNGYKAAMHACAVGNLIRNVGTPNNTNKPPNIPTATPFKMQRGTHGTLKDPCIRQLDPRFVTGPHTLRKGLPSWSSRNANRRTSQASSGDTFCVRQSTASACSRQ